uniref:(northern house mosquito) hypothetical protein n=1 Tax=Culex pipiens TaxID=7175 RepID=A0A8D8F876_CULPI
MKLPFLLNFFSLYCLFYLGFLFSNISVCSFHILEMQNVQIIIGFPIYKKMFLNKNFAEAKKYIKNKLTPTNFVLPFVVFLTFDFTQLFLYNLQIFRNRFQSGQSVN